jgi:hypothetical protein
MMDVAAERHNQTQSRAIGYGFFEEQAKIEAGHPADKQESPHMIWMGIGK